MSWIKMRVELASDPAVMRLAKITGLDRFAVIGRLFSLWAWTDVNSSDGKVQFVDADDLVHVVGSRDFVDALCKISWLKIKKTHVELPNFSKHNGETAKARLQKNQRQAKWRERKNVDAPPSTPVDKNASTREEKRREENKHQGLGTRTASPVDNLRALHPKPIGNKLPKVNGNGKTQPGGWWSTAEAMDAIGREWGIAPRPGEIRDEYRQRLFAEQERRKRATA